jgi:hypothetical protein
LFGPWDRPSRDSLEGPKTTILIILVLNGFEPVFTHFEHGMQATVLPQSFPGCACSHTACSYPIAWPLCIYICACIGMYVYVCVRFGCTYSHSYACTIRYANIDVYIYKPTYRNIAVHVYASEIDRSPCTQSCPRPALYSTCRILEPLEPSNAGLLLLILLLLQ